MTSDQTRYHNHETFPRQQREYIIFSLIAEIAVLEHERAELEKQVTELESEIDTLEDTVANKDRQLQQVIDQYERVIEEKNCACQTTTSERVSTSTKCDSPSSSTVRQLVNGVVPG